jgi:hypothetical protein
MLSKLKLFIQTHVKLSIILGLILLLFIGTATYIVIRTITSNHKSSSITSNNPSGSSDDTKQKDTSSPSKSSDGTKKSEDKSKQATNKTGGSSTVPSNNGTGGGGSNTPQPNTPGDGGSTGPKKNCIIKPSACGYPDGSNTGYKHTGVTLSTSGITINQDGDFIISQDNTIIDSKRIDGCVIVRAKNVTIKRSLITNCQAFYNIWMQELPGGGIRDTSNFLMEDVEVDGNQVFTNAAIVDDNGKGMTIRRMDMHDVADGPHPGENWLIEDSYIHNMYVCPNDCHTDSIQSAGAINVTIRHNTILNNPDNNGTGGKNAVVRIATEQGPVNGFIVDNNLLDGGNYAVQVRSQGNGAPTGVVITNNRIVPTWRFAPYDFTGIPLTLTGNFRDDTLEALDTPM